VSERTIQEVRSVTYGVDGKPILRLKDHNHVTVKGELLKKDPIKTYLETKK
jgi:hypothetical protein